MYTDEMVSANNYNFVDRILHRFAFCSPLVQKALSQLENDLFKRELESVRMGREVFVTGLPRAGTTLVLELLYGTAEFGTYTYRTMPFVLAPLLWAKASGSFQQAGELKERAHGDNVKISFDSPEAFEEVVWLAYLEREIVRERTLATLTCKAVSDETRQALRDSVRKILALTRRGTPDGPEPRYLSKNNANISRIDVLLDVFPTSDILVLYRNPVEHTSSLARQHKRFLERHVRDGFSKAYMKWLGHYEFGENLKPIDFDGWLDGGGPSGIDAAFWLRYWNSAYSYALDRKADRVHFVDFDKLLADPEESLKRIAGVLNINRADALINAAGVLRATTTRAMPETDYPPAILDRAEDIRAKLGAIAV